MNGNNSHILGVKELETNYALKLDQFKAQGIEILNSHCGVFNESVVNDLAYGTESILKERGAQKSSVKRIFSLLVELVQNMFLHGAYEEKGKFAFLIVGIKDGTLHVASANITVAEKVEKIRAKIAKVNNLDREGLKEFYLEILTNGEISDKGGAGLGFITIGMKSKNELLSSFEKLNDEYTLFFFETKINE